MIAIGVDIGTTRTKVLGLDIGSGETRALESAPTPMQQGVDGDAHQAVDVLETVIELMAGVSATLDAGDQVTAICVASVGEEVVLLDHDDRPVGDTMAWYDPRGFEEAEAFAAGPGAGVALSQRWPPDPTFSLFKLMWTRDHRPDAYLAATSWTDLGDYVLMGLGGAPVMDWSHASRAGAFDLVERAWDIETIAAAGLRVGFPRLVPSGTVIGTVKAEIAERTGLPSGVPVVTGGHDHLCAAFGAGVRSTAELFLSAGTSEAHLALLDAPVLSGDGRYRIDQGCYVDAATYYAHINIHSGHFFRQWRELLYRDVPDEAMYSEVEAVPLGAEGIAFELLDDLRHGRLDSVPYGAGRDRLMRAILEGLAQRSADIVDCLEGASGRPFRLILAAGHPTRVPIWKTIRMAAYDRPMAAVDEPESAAFGAAVIGAQAVSAAGADALIARRVAWGHGDDSSDQGSG